MLRGHPSNVGRPFAPAGIDPADSFHGNGDLVTVDSR